MTMTPRALVVTAMLLTVPFSRPLAEPQESLERIMKLKLEYSQAILKSIVTDDFTSLSRQARELGKLTESSQWGVLRTPEYARQSADFLRAAEGLANAAAERNAEGAALEYVGLTLK